MTSKSNQNARPRRRADPLRVAVAAGVRGAKGEGSAHTPTEAPDTLRSIAFARILDLVSEGEIEGFALGPDRAMECIYLDKTPIGNADGSLNFQNVQVDSRSGTQSQTYMTGFPAVENEVLVGVELKSGTQFTRAITDLDLTAIRLRIAVPNGLQSSNASTGDINGYSIAYKIEIQADSGAYVTMVDGVFKGKASGNYERSHRIDLPPATTGWNMRVTRTTANANSATVADTTNIVSLTEIVDGKFRYPNSALVGIVIDASQFQNIPTRGYHLKGRIVSVPSNYDPVARTYAGTWDGSFKPAYTNNPAWVYYDIAVNPRFGLGDRITPAQINKWALYAIGQYCDGMVPDGKGGLEPRFTCNVYLQTSDDAYKVLSDLATVFRGISYYAGGMIQASADMPSDPVYTYTDANTVANSDGVCFSYAGAARSTRYNVVLVSWNDPSNFYAPAVEPVQDPEGIARFGIQKTEVTAIGCTSQGQAQRFGRWTYLTSKLESEIGTVTVGLDGTLSLPGQVVRYADASRMGRRVAGRISSATSTSITVDAAPVASVGDTITVTLPSGVTESHAITAISGKTISVAGPGFSAIPVAQSVWLVESTELTAPTYRVLGRKDNGDMTYTITALRHIAGKFDAIDNDTIITIPPTSLLLPKTQPAPASVSLTSLETAGTVVSSMVLTISWAAAPGASSYLVEYQANHGEWVPLAPVTGLSVDIQHVKQGDYIARVTARNALGNSSLPKMSATYTVVDQTLVPESVSAAAAAASAAAAAAAAANAQIAQISSDGVWTPSEKSVVIRDYNVIIAEQTGIDGQAVAFGISTEKTAYDNAVTALAVYLPTLTSPTLWSNLAGNTNIVSATVRSKFGDVYTTRQTLLNTIYAAAKNKADAAQATADVAGSGVPVFNPVFLNNLAGWTFDTSGAGEWVRGTGGNSPDAAQTTFLSHNGVAGQATTCAHNMNGGIPVKVGQTVTALVALKSVGANAGARAYVRIGWCNSAGAIITNSTQGVTICSPSAGAGYFTQGVSRVYGTAPATAVRAIVEIEFDSHTSGSFTATSASIGHLAASVDEVPDGATYIRSIQQSANSSAISIDNATFQLAKDASGNIPGWMNDTADLFYLNATSPAPNYGAQYAAVHGPGRAVTTKKYACKPGDKISLGGIVASLNGASTGLQAIFYDASDTIVGAVSALTTSTAWADIANSGAVTSGAVYMRIALYGGSVSVYTAYNYVWCSINDVRVAGSGARLGDMRNQVMVGVGNYGAGWTGGAITYSASSTSATISFASGTLQTGPSAVAYGASSTTVSGSAGLVRTYYLYYDDDSYAGGSKTLNATTSQITSISANGRVFVGTVTVTFPTSGTGGGGGGNPCPDENAWVLRADPAGAGPDWTVRAKEIEVGHYLRLTDGRTGLVTYSERKASPRVRVVAEHGRSLTCSTTAPLELAGHPGRCVLAPDSQWELVLARFQGDPFWAALIEDVENLDDGYVQHITCENACFWTGDDPDYLFGHHNLKPLGP